MTATQKVSAVTSKTFPRRGRVGYLVLIALAWFQLAYASHQFEHVIGDLFDACAICKQMQRHDAAVAPQPAEIPFAASLPVPVAIPASPHSAKLLRHYESRAPPSV